MCLDISLPVAYTHPEREDNHCVRPQKCSSQLVRRLRNVAIVLRACFSADGTMVFSTIVSYGRSPEPVKVRNDVLAPAVVEDHSPRHQAHIVEQPVRLQGTWLILNVAESQRRKRPRMYKHKKCLESVSEKSSRVFTKMSARTARRVNGTRG